MRSRAIGIVWGARFDKLAGVKAYHGVDLACTCRDLDGEVHLARSWGLRTYERRKVPLNSENIVEVLICLSPD